MMDLGSYPSGEADKSDEVGYTGQDETASSPQGKSFESDQRFDFKQNSGSRLSIISTRDTNGRSTMRKESGLNPFTSVC